MTPRSRVAQPQHDTELTIGDLAERTGLSPAVLRMWESRHGFPTPRRLESGHRRYNEGDVVLIEQVLRRRQSGIPAGHRDLRGSALRAP